MRLNPNQGILGKTYDSYWSKWVLGPEKVRASPEIFTAKSGVNDGLKSTECLLLPTTIDLKPFLLVRENPQFTTLEIH